MNFSGYIEGYYGQLLSWTDRLRILSALAQNDLRSYLYCPKEDQFHRTIWRELYSNEWMDEFKHFVSIADSKGIEIIFGISPGIDFELDDDLQILIEKIRSVENLEIKNIAILFDDLFKNSSGELHAKIINECIEQFPDINFFAVPQEYSSSQASPDIYLSNYLNDFNKALHPEVPIFWTGSYVVSKITSSEEIEQWDSIFQRPIIFWDNYFANDYCGPKVVLESYKSMTLESTKKLNGLMINPTGLIEVDLICIDFLGNFLNNIEITTAEYFLNKSFPPEFIDSLNLFKFEITIVNAKLSLAGIESLLWTWHHPLKQELYSYLHMLRFILLEQNEESIMALKKRFRILD
tara:strand:- start:144 stop:1193 length:1050 start_codon:yes stop_codon:yes gene_type:complete